MDKFFHSLTHRTLLRRMTSFGASLWVFLGLLSATSAAENRTADSNASVEPETIHQWIEDMKAGSRGPFQRIRWFCNDGTVLPPTAYACAAHGGGRQHGEWSERTQQIRAAGYPIGNVLAAVELQDVLTANDPNSLLQSILLEQFLIRVDDGWILRKARNYRGAFQAEAEERSARRILLALLAEPDWVENRLALIHEAARWLPHGGVAATSAEVRALALELHRLDPGFAALRNKIHSKPDPADAQRVRDYAARAGRPGLQDHYARLASRIERDSDRNAPAFLNEQADVARDRALAQMLRNHAAMLQRSGDASEELARASRASAELRDRIANLHDPADRLAALDAIVALEFSVFKITQPLRNRLPEVPRATRLAWLGDTARTLYGSGLITPAEWSQLANTLDRLQSKEVPLKTYRERLDELARLPVWAHRRLAFHFSPAIERFRAIEAQTEGYITDRLRGSPALFYADVLESLTTDANQLSGVSHRLFDATVSTGLRSLNPGVARGTLYTLEDFLEARDRPENAILIVPETLADLPPVAGILTEHEGNQLSHVQLLARNLGIPNIVVDDSHLAVLRAHSGQKVFLASSPGGVVQLQLYGARHDAYFPKHEEKQATRIVVNLDKLNLEHTALIPVRDLRASDSGVIVGPKAAQLGELTAQFPDAVSPGLAIPFGAFRNLLDQPFDAAGPSAFEWLKTRYSILAEIRDPAERARFRNAFLAQFRQWIMTAELDEQFLNDLRAGTQQTFGADGTYGVFVRSDTNVEDLPGFTGAGLNLTVPNVVGFDAMVQAIRRVWASPFTERAFGWRQALMDKPEHVYAAVLLHQSVNSDKSGVLVTTDVESGRTDRLTVVVNEGVGGGVEGQSAETVVIGVPDGRTRLLSSATAPQKRVLLPRGGSKLVRASGRARALNSSNVRDLVRLAQALPCWFGEPGVIADVEFGFIDDRLVLFQIRPFVDNDAARKNQYLQSFDASLRRTANLPVKLNSS